MISKQQQQLERKATATRLDRQEQICAQLIDTIRAEYGPEAVTLALEMLQLRRECQSAVASAMATNSRCYVKHGVLCVTGSNANNSRRRLARFNSIPPGHHRSLAALYFEQLGGSR